MKFPAVIALALAFGVLVSGDDRSREHERRENIHEHKAKDDQVSKKEESKATRANSERELTANPVVGHFNVTGKGGQLCIRMDAAIRLDITYQTKNGSQQTTTIVSDNRTSVSDWSECVNGSLDWDESLLLNLGKGRTLKFDFTRDQNVTGDKSGGKWQLYRITFRSPDADAASDFPGAKDPVRYTEITNTDPLKQIVSSRDRSYGCTKLDAIPVTDGFTVTLTDLRVQAFMTNDNFGQADWCAQEQTSDLIPIIIGAALAALVIIVLIAYLVGRARARTTNYDNI